MGGAHQSTASSAKDWLLGLYSIDAGTGAVSANGIQYESISYEPSSVDYQFI
jgi:hypothetical protein